MPAKPPLCLFRVLTLVPAPLCTNACTKPYCTTFYGMCRGEIRGFYI